MRQPRSIPVGGVRGREEGCERLLPRAAAPVRYVVYSAPSSALLRVRLVNENGKCSVPHTRYYRVRTTSIYSASCRPAGPSPSRPRARGAPTLLCAESRHQVVASTSWPKGGSSGCAPKTCAGSMIFVTGWRTVSLSTRSNSNGLNWNTCREAGRECAEVARARVRACMRTSCNRSHRAASSSPRVTSCAPKAPRCRNASGCGRVPTMRPPSAGTG